VEEKDIKVCLGQGRQLYLEKSLCYGSVVLKIFLGKNHIMPGALPMSVTGQLFALGTFIQLSVQVMLFSPCGSVQTRSTKYICVCGRKKKKDSRSTFFYGLFHSWQNAYIFSIIVLTADQQCL